MSQTNVNVPGGSSSDGMGAGMIIGLVLAVIIIGFLVWWFLLNGGGGGTPVNSSAPLNSTAPLQSLIPSILPTRADRPANPHGVGAASSWAAVASAPLC